MTNAKYKHFAAKAVGFALAFSTLLGVLMLGAPTSTVYAADNTVSVTTNWKTGYSWNLSSEIQGPQANENAGRISYTPTSYVYVGGIYNPTTLQVDPVLCRVLDANADSTGGTGAMFLLTEQGVAAEAWYRRVWGQNPYGVAWKNIYTQSGTYYAAQNGTGSIFTTGSVNELNYVRPITKTDVKANMDGLFGYRERLTQYYFETDLMRPANESAYEQYLGFMIEPEHAASAEYLNNTPFFLLSVEEVSQYLGNYNGAAGLKTTNAQGDPIVWVTRTGLGVSDMNGLSDDGNLVAGIDGDGNVIPVDVDDDTAYTRLGLNMSTSEITYTHKLNGNTYQLAYLHPTYESGTNQFTAEILGTDESGVVTLRYSGVDQDTDTQGMDAYVSVAITDASGNIKRYATVGEVPGDKTGFDTTAYTLQFKLPTDYDEANDKIRVFWEFKPDNGKGLCYTSNVVELTCAHKASNSATCIAKAACTHCDQPMGDLNPDNHANLSQSYTQLDVNGVPSHGFYCSACDKHVGVTPCTYQYNDCSGACVCGRTHTDTTRCRYKENGICETVPSHYESPAYVVVDSTRHEVEVIIENEGQWLFHASLVNSGTALKNESGYYVYYPGQPRTIVLNADLDFTGMNFIPMGVSEENKYPVGELICRGGNTISGISYSSDTTDNVGIFGYVKNFNVTGLKVTDCQFTGRNNVGLIGHAENAEIRDVEISESSFTGASKVGAVVGYAKNVKIQKTLAMDYDGTAPITVSAADGTEGAFIGLAELSGQIDYGCLAINVKNASGANLPFASADSTALTVSEYAFCLADADCPAGTTWNGQTSATTFASGKVAYALQRLTPGWSQIVDKTEMDSGGDMVPLPAEPFPRYIPTDANGNRAEKVYMVYTITYCNQSDTNYYTNNATRDRSSHKPEEVLEWCPDGFYCEALVKCALCGAEDVMTAKVDAEYLLAMRNDNTPSYVVRTNFTATLLDANGNEYTDGQGTRFSHEYFVISRTLESLIGITPVVMDYDGHGMRPEDFMTNHRLYSGGVPAFEEYEAWFVDEEGNKLWETGYDSNYQPIQVPVSAVNAGTYDLLVVGKNAYAGQECTFEDVLVINPVVVELEPHDVYKYHDGTTTFEVSYTPVDPELEKAFHNNSPGENYTVTFGEAKSAAEGVYEISVTVTSNHDAKNVQFVLTRDTVQAVIMPRTQVTVENKNYPTTFTYGDTIPAPAPEHFSFTEGSTLTFEWYQADIKISNHDSGNGVFETTYEVISLIARLEGTPKNAGKYVLRVHAGAAGNLAAAYIDLPVIIEQADSLSVIIDTTGLDKYTDYYYGDYYIVEVGQFPNGLPYRVEGLLNGDTLESAGIRVYMTHSYAEGYSYSYSGFPTVPDGKDYNVIYTLYCEGAYGGEGNYKSASVRASILVRVVPGTGAKPVPDSFLVNPSTPDEEPWGVDVVLTWPEIEGAQEYTVKVMQEETLLKTITRTVGDHVNNNIRNGNIFAIYRVTQAGEYTVTVNDTHTFTFTVDIRHENSPAEMLDSIGTDLGRYIVKVTQGEESHSADVYVRRRITMLVKETEFNLDSDTLTLDPTRIVMEAGNVILLNHTLQNVEVKINPLNGTITVESITVVEDLGDGTYRDVSHYYQIDNNNSTSDGSLNRVHVFDNACDATCNSYNCQYTRAVYHSGGKATCSDQAICEACGVPYGETNPDNHIHDETRIIPNPLDLNTHWVIHTCCGHVKAVAEHVEKTAATCSHRAVCAECGWEYGELDPDNHEPHVFTYEYVDGSTHKAVYSCCGAWEIHGHEGGTATCSDAAVCQHCKSSYGAPDPSNHTGEIVYKPHETDPALHTVAYSCCGFTETARHSGGVETCQSAAICTRCNAAYGAIDPHNHTSEELTYSVRSENASMHNVTHACCGAFVRKEYHSGGTATCNSAAICQHCGGEYGTKDGVNHHESDQLVYKVDMNHPDQHVVSHACCGLEITREAHTGGTATCQHGAICEHCGSAYGERAEHVFDNACDSICNVCEKQVRPLVFHVDANGDLICDTCGKALSAGEGVSLASVVRSADLPRDPKEEQDGSSNE